jgi:hypothetical protein
MGCLNICSLKFAKGLFRKENEIRLVEGVKSKDETLDWDFFAYVKLEFFPTQITGQ